MSSISGSGGDVNEEELADYEDVARGMFEAGRVCLPKRFRGKGFTWEEYKAVCPIAENAYYPMAKYAYDLGLADGTESK